MNRQPLERRKGQLVYPTYFDQLLSIIGSHRQSFDPMDGDMTSDRGLQSWFTKLFQIKPLKIEAVYNMSGDGFRLELFELLLGWERLQVGVVGVGMHPITEHIVARLQKKNCW